MEYGAPVGLAVRVTVEVMVGDWKGVEVINLYVVGLDSIVKVGRGVLVSVGGRVTVGVQVGAKPIGVQVAVGGGGIWVLGGKGFRLEAGLLISVTK